MRGSRTTDEPERGARRVAPAQYKAPVKSPGSRARRSPEYRFRSVSLHGSEYHTAVSSMHASRLMQGGSSLKVQLERNTHNNVDRVTLTSGMPFLLPFCCTYEESISGLNKLGCTNLWTAKISGDIDWSRTSKLELTVQPPLKISIGHTTYSNEVTSHCS
jgi:hypothetical protein